MGKNVKRTIAGLILVAALYICEIRGRKVEELHLIMLFECFCTIHMSLFALLPISKLLAKEGEHKKLFWTLFYIRVIILLLGDSVNAWVTFIVDFILIFVGAFIVVPVLALIKKKDPFTGIAKENIESSQSTSAAAVTASSQPLVNKIYKCSKCEKEVALGNKYCPNCGTALTENDYVVKDSTITTTDAREGTPFNKAEYDNYLFGDIKKAAGCIIKENIAKNPENVHATLPIIEKKKNTITFVFSIAITILLIIYFAYHINWLIIASFIGIIIYFLVMKNYSIEKHLVKEVISRPSEKIDYVISSTLSGKVVDNRRNKLLRTGLIVLTISLQLLLFNKPHLIYEKTDGGYAVRYYTIGILKKDRELKIPKEYNGEPVVSIRGSVFARIGSIEKVTLPNTIKEIRGEAFIGCYNLESINIPDGVTEIKGSTFEGCSSLKSIDIPKGVTRIGGSAFRECTSLEKVTIPKTVIEIGSSAFRGTAINNVCVSINASINERAFKDTNANIAYHEYGCVNTNGSGYGYGYGNEYESNYGYENEYNNNEYGYDYDYER